MSRITTRNLQGAGHQPELPEELPDDPLAVLREDVPLKNRSGQLSLHASPPKDLRRHPPEKAGHLNKDKGSKL